MPEHSRAAPYRTVQPGISPCHLIPTRGRARTAEADAQPSGSSCPNQSPRPSSGSTIETIPGAGGSKADTTRGRNDGAAENGENLQEDHIDLRNREASALPKTLTTFDSLQTLQSHSH